MPFQVPTFEQIRDTYLQGIRNQEPDAPTGVDSDHYVRGCAVAAVVERVYAHQVWVWRQEFPDLADEDILVKMAAQRGVPRKVAKVAAGVVRFTGPAGTLIPTGTRLTTLLASYVTTQDATIGGTGSIDVAMQAEAAGQAANVSVLTNATLSSSVPGVTLTKVVSASGGSDTESAAALLDRLLAVQSQPAQGGNENDYKVWALEVPGVRRAKVFPLRRGTGTVDVVPMPEAGLPSAQLLADVQAYIDARKPVGMGPTGFLALAPTAVPVNITGTVTLASGYTLAQVLVAINAALQVIFNGLLPGDVVHVVRITSAIINVPGVLDVVLTAPAANVAPTVSGSALQLATLGVVALGAA
jgi:uncharacterized phage protein gp47/JayE